MDAKELLRRSSEKERNDRVSPGLLGRLLRRVRAWLLGPSGGREMLGEWERIWKSLAEHLHEESGEGIRERLRGLNCLQLAELLLDYGLGRSPETPRLLGVERVSGLLEYAERRAGGRAAPSNAWGYIECSCDRGAERLGELLHGSLEEMWESVGSWSPTAPLWREELGLR
jgi:hypothetical protein